MRIIDIEPNTEAWKAWRLGGLGASDIPAIMGVCPYKTALDVFNDKKGYGARSTNVAMERGHKYEGRARELLNHQFYGIVNTNFKPICIEHDEISYFRASLDGWDGLYLCEIKVPGKKDLELAKKGKIPENYRYQMQWQMYLTETQRAIYCVYDVDEDEIYYFEIERDEALIASMIMEATRFWEMVLNDEPPASKKDTYFLFDDKADDMLYHMEYLKAYINKFQAEYDECKAQFIELWPRDTSIETERFILQRSERQNIDYKKAAEDANVDLGKYKKPISICWTLKVKDVDQSR